jgi:hypothetical protein
MHLFAGIEASGRIMDGIGYFGNFSLGMILAINAYICRNGSFWTYQGRDWLFRQLYSGHDFGN